MFKSSVEVLLEDTEMDAMCNVRADCAFLGTIRTQFSHLSTLFGTAIIDTRSGLWQNEEQKGGGEEERIQAMSHKIENMYKCRMRGTLEIMLRS